MTSPHMRHDLLYGNIRLFAGTSTPELAQEISDYLGTPLCGRDVIEFTNENLFVKLHASVRGQDCYIIQTTSIPVHRNLMELLIMTQTLRLDSAGRITVVVPYMCYGRSDRKDQPRVPITARLVADMIQVAGADRYITMDLHAGPPALTATSRWTCMPAKSRVSFPSLGTSSPVITSSSPTSWTCCPT